METRANYIAIGAFVIVVTIAAVVFSLWLKRTGETSAPREVVLLVPANAGGLKEGGGVLFNGKRVGSVTEVEYRQSDPTKLFAKLLVEGDIPLRKDTKVGVSVQPLTGLSNVTLVGGSPDKPPLFDLEEMPILVAETSSLQETIDAAAQTVETANKVLAKVDKLLSNNVGSINTTVQNVEKFSTALASNADGIDALLKNVAETSEAINALGNTIAAVSDDIESVVAAVEPDRVKNTLANVEKITGDIAASSGEVDVIIRDAKSAIKDFSDLSATLKDSAKILNDGTIDRTLKNVETLTGDLTKTVAKVDGVVEAIDPATVKTTLGNVETITTKFAESSKEIDGIIAGAKDTVENFAVISSRLTETADALDGDKLKRTLDNVETFTGGLNKTLQKVDRVVGAIDEAKVASTLDSLEGFAGRLNEAGDEIDSIIGNAQSATSDVAAFTKSLSGNKEAIDKVIADAAVISTRLIETSEVINRLVGRVDGLVEADGKGFIAEATDAAKAIRQIAESFEKRADNISAGLEKFSTRGLSDIETLIAESRQAVSRIEGIVRNLEENPAQFLVGGKRVPEYRQRR